MIDIETTGIDKKLDDILEIALVEIKLTDYWRPTGKVFHEILHSKKQPQNHFAKEHMRALYARCNKVHESKDYSWCALELSRFLHTDKLAGFPAFIMGWNASIFDVPFMFEKGIASPSFYTDENELRGDFHYRVYEQTGSLNLICNILGLKRDVVQDIASVVNPGEIELPSGKSHDALYDCYSQIKLMNGLIWLGRTWPTGV